MKLARAFIFFSVLVLIGQILVVIAVVGEMITYQ